MILKPSCLKTTVTSLIALSVFLPVAGCDLANNHLKQDRSTNSEFQDYRDAMAPREALFDDASVASDIPDLQAYVADDVEQAAAMPLVSISINQSIPVREALFELAKQADFDVELDPRIQGSVIFTARNKPLDVVIDRICEISGLRYKIDGSTLRIELDTPYSKNYKLDYLSFVRNNSSSMKTDVSVASSTGDSGGVSGGSKFSVETKSDADFWAELDTNIKQILTSNANGSYLKTTEDPQITLTTSSPAVPPVPPVDAAALQEGSAAASVAPKAGEEYYVSSPMSVPAADQTVAAAAPTADAASSPAPSVNVDTTATPAPAGESATSSAAPSAVGLGDEAAAAPVTAAPTLKIESLPTSLASGGTNTSQNQVTFTPTYSINKQAGIISVYANERLHKKVGEYLDEIKTSVSSQVLIEAKVLEVSLTDEFSAGIDWGVLDIGDMTLGTTFGKPSFTAPSTNGIAFSLATTDLSSLVDALSRFGTVHALASPRLTVLNNQSAVLNVAKNQVYFELDVQSDSTQNAAGDNTTSTTVDSDIKTVPEGVLINVLPSIDLAKRLVSMQVRPTVTKISGYVDDPGVSFIALQAGVDIESQIPIVNVQEVDSVVNMKSGEVMVMGGLLQDGTRSTQEGVPVASEIPVFGGLFRNQGDIVEKKELVIFLKATILNSSSDSIHQTDRELYRLFSQDRRPEKL